MLLAAALLAPVVITEALTIGSVGRGGRIPFPTDMVVDQVIGGAWKAPVEGDKLGERTWVKKKAGADGNFTGLQGYAFATVDWPKDEVAILAASGHGMVYVNGQPRMGDPYDYGYSKLPVHMHEGKNELLFANGRGKIHAQIEEAPAPLFWNLADLTAPDLLNDDKSHAYYLGAILVNATDGASRPERYEVTIDGKTVAKGDLPILQPLEARKVPIRFEVKPPNGESVKCTLAIKGGNTQDITLRIRGPHQTRKVTFLSQIDGSVQYYGLYPPENLQGKALALSVHGASVEAIGQADAYSAKPDTWIVCPTNRRPYGFDWEDIGRMDAMEVLSLAMKEYKIDPKQVYLTGHSMGGHGTWILGATFPQLFAAIAPSAGWRSFFTYAGKPKDSGNPVIDFLATASNSSATELMYDNYRSEEVYILHGDADDNVPVAEARAMKQVFADMNKPIGYHEQPGAGHWWDGDVAKGADCVDWPDIFAMFAKTRLKTDPPLDFVTVNPAISSGYPGAEILQQEKKLRPSRIKVTKDPEGIVVKTENVQAVKLSSPVKSIDGDPVDPPRSKSLFQYAEKVDGKWKTRQFMPKQTGPFKEAFQNHLILVYGTHGSPEENTWMLNKARFDAEQLWYRGNGGVEIIPDTKYNDGNGSRNLVVYGNAAANSVWQTLIGDTPMKLAPGQGVLMARPQHGRMVAAIGGEGIVGMRATERLPYFVSGVGYPDWVVVSSAIAAKGYDAVLGAGYWKPDGSIGETVGIDK